MRLSVFRLLKKIIFLPIFLTQFFGAFNDNAFKLATLTFISYFLSTSQTESEHYQALAGGLFIFPFFIFSATAGQLADKYDKARMTRIIKLFEVLLMLIGGFGFYFGNIILLMVTLTGMGIHSTFFGPIKYAILPEHVPKKSLMGATALVEGSTFLAILLGTILGALSIGGTKSDAFYAIGLTCFAAVAGLSASLFIPPTPPSEKNLKVDWQLFRATFEMLRAVFRNRKIAPAIIALSWFWLIGVVILTKLPDYTNYTLRAESSVFALFLSLFSIGIAFGSLMINQVLAGKLTLRYVPVAMLLLTLFACDLYWATPTFDQNLPLQGIQVFFSDWRHWRIAFDLFLMAVSGGLFVVPLYTHLQIASDGRFRSRTIAANNIVNALFMVSGTLLVMGLLSFHIPIAQVFLIMGVLNFFASGLIWYLLS